MRANTVWSALEVDYVSTAVMSAFGSLIRVNTNLATVEAWKLWTEQEGRGGLAAALPDF